MYKNWHKFKKHHRLAISLIILSGIVSFWRGIYGLLEIFLYPGNQLLSFFLSLAIGMLILGDTHYTIERIV